MTNKTLTIDIGNTNINLGVFAGRTLIRRLQIPTKSRSYAGLFESLFKRHRPEQILVCSVMPVATRMLVHDIKKLSRAKVYIIGKDIKVPVPNRYLRPKQVGQDRLVNAYAGIKLYGAPLIVVDFGTAVTFDVVSKKGEYLGGMIIPGLKISLDVLSERTALLPKVKLNVPTSLIGKDTRQSMLSGIVYGYAALCDDLVRRIKRVIGVKAKVIATGGDAVLLKRYARSIDLVDSDLTLKGIHLLTAPPFRTS
jgi:type III pantothenate kinase